MLVLCGDEVVNVNACIVCGDEVVNVNACIECGDEVVSMLILYVVIRW